MPSEVRRETGAAKPAVEAKPKDSASAVTAETPDFSASIVKSVHDGSAADVSQAADTCPAVPAMQTVSRSGAAQDKAEGGLVRVRSENMNRLMALAGECLVQAQSVKTVYQNLLGMKRDIVELEKPLRLFSEDQMKNQDGERDANLGETLTRVAYFEQTVSQEIIRFERFSRRLEHLAHRLYNEVISSRMVPFSDGLHGFSRMVRDLARETGKQIRFEIAGSTTPVDRDILEKLEAPLSHLIRNAIDHGVETPQLREAAGKSAEGTITLEARHIAGMLNISLSDDGCGINPEDLRGKVVEKGYVSSEMAGSLSRAELFEFLFLPGFSTARDVTEISGRGGSVWTWFSTWPMKWAARCAWIPNPDGFPLPVALLLTLSCFAPCCYQLTLNPKVFPCRALTEFFLLPLPRSWKLKTVSIVPWTEKISASFLPASFFSFRRRPAPQIDIIARMISDRLNRYGLVVDHVIGEENLVVRPLTAGWEKFQRKRRRHSG